MCVSMCLYAYAGRVLFLWIKEAITNKTLMRKATRLLESAGVYTSMRTCSDTLNLCTRVLPSNLQVLTGVLVCAHVF